MGGGWDGGGMGGAGWVLVAVMMVVFWAAVFAAVIAFVQYRGHGHTELPSGGDARGQALQILDERFARGEIDAEDYAQRRDLLRAR